MMYYLHTEVREDNKEIIISDVCIDGRPDITSIILKYPYKYQDLKINSNISTVKPYTIYSSKKIDFPQGLIPGTELVRAFQDLHSLVMTCYDLGVQYGTNKGDN